MCGYPLSACEKMRITHGVIRGGVILADNLLRELSPVHYCTISTDSSVTRHKRRELEQIHAVSLVTEAP